MNVSLLPPGEKHWHDATPTTAMNHIAIQEQLTGKTVDWMEKVSDGCDNNICHYHDILDHMVFCCIVQMQIMECKCKLSNECA
jgi:hypothetical protein